MSLAIPGRWVEEWIQSSPPLRGFSLKGRSVWLLLCYQGSWSGLNAGSWPQNIQQTIFVGKCHFIKFAFFMGPGCVLREPVPATQRSRSSQADGNWGCKYRGFIKRHFTNRAITVFLSQLPFVLEVLSAQACAGKHLCPLSMRQPKEERGKKEKILCPESFSWQPGKAVEFFSPVFLSLSKGGSWKLKFGSSLCTG